jgi:hypothetical protein
MLSKLNYMIEKNLQFLFNQQISIIIFILSFALSLEKTHFAIKLFDSK